jgi:phosphatidylinositol alpha-1,6-mannosyltransferase
MGGGIARLMGEIARGYPAGSLVVSTGRAAGAPAWDATCRNRIDRLARPSQRLRTVPGLAAWSRRAAELAREERVSFCWCGNVKPAGYPACWLQRRLGIPYGLLVYGMDLLILGRQARRSSLKRRLARLILGRAATIVAISHWTRTTCLALLEELELPASEAGVRIALPGTDPEIFRPGVDTSGIRERYRLEAGAWFVTVARLTTHKGLDTALRAVAALAERGETVRYAVIGTGALQHDLESLAKQLGIAQRVRFLTGVPDADLPAFYNLATGYLGLSRQVGEQVEGFGLSLIEASACGTPVIAARSGGIADAVVDGETGLLVPEDDAASAAEVMGRLLEDPILASRLGNGGRRVVERRLNRARMVADLARIAEEVTTGFRDRPAGR